MTTVNSHYVPIFLLKNWVLKTDQSQQDNLLSMSWHSQANRIIAKHNRGPKGYCTVEEYVLPKNGPFKEDMIETQLFTPIDTKASISLREMEKQKITKIEHGTKITKLNNFDQRLKQNFILFILSLMSRAPHILSATILNKKEVIKRLDENKEMIEYFKKEKIKLLPSDWIKSIGLSLDNMALFLSYSHIKSESSRLGLLRKEWNILEIDKSIGSFILSDTPVFASGGSIQKSDYLHLPITPQKVLIICNNLEKTILYSKSPQQKMRIINTTNARVAMRYIFTINKNDKNWLEKYLKESIGYPKNIKMKQ